MKIQSEEFLNFAIVMYTVTYNSISLLIFLQWI
jgi:hypothetical protein